MKKSIYYLLKTILLLGMIASLYFSAHFSIGTKEAWDKQVQEHFFEFWFSRLAFTLFIGAIFFLVSFLVDWMFRKVIQRNRKSTVIEMFLIVILTLAFVALAVNK
jgi:hypothetical protein